MRHRSEAHDDFLAIPFHRLAGAQSEAGPRPAPAIELQRHLGEGLGAMFGSYSVFLDVGRDVTITHPPGPVAGSASTDGDGIVVEWAHRTQNVDLAVAQISLPQAERRLHRHQAEELQEMVLHHVLERPDVVVIASPSLERE